jgi:hypothetical protein
LRAYNIWVGKKGSLKLKSISNSKDNSLIIKTKKEEGSEN